MYDYLQRGNFTNEWAGFDYRVSVAEQFLDHYSRIHAQDIYRWLWEGEFGAGSAAPDLDLNRLVYDLRLARIRTGSQEEPIWEPMGLSMKILKINLVPYADSGCPLMRLIEMNRKSREVRPNTLRFKRDWSFMKTQIIPGMSVSVDEMVQFENTIAFHMTPEASWSDDFMDHYGMGYRLVPQSIFFKHFPEYEPVDADMLRFVLEEE